MTYKKREIFAASLISSYSAPMTKICFAFIFSLLISASAEAQTTAQIHFKQVHTAQSYTGSDGEALIVRGTLHSGKKISLRIKGIVTLPYGSNLKSECVKLMALAAASDQLTLELFYIGPSITVGSNDLWQYKEATLTLPSSASFTCLLANVTKYDYSQTTIVWYDLP